MDEAVDTKMDENCSNFAAGSHLAAEGYREPRRLSGRHSSMLEI